MKRLRVYVDTSVIGGCLDKEFANESRMLFDRARSGEVELVISDILPGALNSCIVDGLTGAGSGSSASTHSRYANQYNKRPE